MIRTDTVEMARKDENKRKILSHIYAGVDCVIGFFAAWWFFSMMRNEVGLSTSVYWLAKASIQQWSFMAVAIIILGLILGGQALYEREMIKKERWLPISFLVISGVLFALYLGCRIVIWTA